MELAEIKLVLDQMMDEIHTNAKAKGFHPTEQKHTHWFADQVNNLHGEVAELWEAYRAGQLDLDCDKTDRMRQLDIPTLTCIEEEEYADIFIRVLDQCARLKVNLPRAIVAKHKYNLTRQYKHGKIN